MLQITISNRSRKIIYVVLLVYWAVLLYVTSVPGISPPLSFNFSDKLHHFIAYLILFLLLSLALEIQNLNYYIKKKHIILALVITIAYGAFDEIHQHFIPNRSCEFFDWVANCAGALTGILLRSIISVKIVET